MAERYLGCMNHTGAFVEVGVGDGLTNSNSFFFEQARLPHTGREVRVRVRSRVRKRKSVTDRFMARAEDTVGLGLR